MSFRTHRNVALGALLGLGSISPALAVKVEGTVSQYDGAAQIYLFEHFGTEFVLIDSAELRPVRKSELEAKFSFQRKEDFPQGLYRLGLTRQNTFPVVLGSEDLEITYDAKNLGAGINISGGSENSLYQQYAQQQAQYTQQLQALDQAYRAMYARYQHDPAGLQTAIKPLQGQLDTLVLNQQAYFGSLAQQYPESFGGRLAARLVISDSTTKENYYRPADFTDPVLLRSDVLFTKLNTYFLRLAPLNGTSYKNELPAALAYADDSAVGRELQHVAVIQMIAGGDPQYAKSLYKDFQKAYPQSIYTAQLEEMFPKGPPDVGDLAPEIAQENPEGQAMPLSELRGKVVLLDFWASWCGPCRREMPTVVKAYERFHDKGFEVYSVSLDRSKDSWVRAIQSDGLIWPYHVSDLGYWQNEAAVRYGVRGIPATYLLDQQGRIIARNLRGPELERKLAEVFGVR